MWEAFNYCEVFAGRFSAEECQRVIAVHQQQSALQSRLPRRDRGLIRDSDLFWVPRMTETAWIFERIRDVATLYNSRYGFGLSGEMGQLQLTRYAAGQLYDWHMDLGGGAMSLRKISVVIELAGGGYDGGGIEVFYGEGSRQPDRSRPRRRVALSVLHHASGAARAERDPLDLGLLADRTRAPEVSGKAVFDDHSGRGYRQ